MENHTDIETLLTKYFEGNTTPPGKHSASCVFLSKL